MANTVMPAKNYEIVLASTVPSTNPASPTISNTFSLGAVNQAEAYIKFVLGSLTNCLFDFQFSSAPDSDDWYSKTLLDITGGTVAGGYYDISVTKAGLVMTQSQNVVIDLPVAYQKGRIVVFGSGTATGSSVQIAVGSGAV